MDKKYRVPKVAITERGLRVMLKKAIREANSARDWAHEHGITPQALSSFLNRTQTSGLKIPEALGYRPQVVYMPLDEELISLDLKKARKK